MSFDMAILVAACQKGGGGKTNTCTNLQVCAELEAIPAVTIDLDPQGSASDWGRIRASARPQTPPAVIASSPARLVDTLRSVRASGVRLAMLDTPGTIGPDIEHAIASSHFVLIPAAPSTADLRASLPTARAARRSARPFAFVLNSCPVAQQRTSDAEALLTQLGAIAGCPIRRRVAFQDAYASGLGIAEQAVDAHATREILVLWQWVKAKLHELGWNAL